MSFKETGTKNDARKPDLGLIHPMLLIQMAHVMAEGDATYGKGNWVGLRVSRILAAMGRHWLAIVSGEDIDPQSRKPHCAHIAAGCSFLAYFMEAGVMGTEQDDRQWLAGKPKTYGVNMADEKVNWNEFFEALRHGWGQNPDAARHFAEDLFGDDSLSANVTVHGLMAEVKEWADSAIGERRTYQNAIQKLVMEELPELLMSPENPLEWGDVMILVLDLAALAGIDPVKAVRDKLAINRERIWAKDERTGLVRHVKPDPESQIFQPGELVTAKGSSGPKWRVESYDPVKKECTLTSDGLKATVPVADLVPATGV